MSNELNLVINFLSSFTNIDLSSIQFLENNRDYLASRFEFTSLVCEFRVAKITSIQEGGFVALWKKSNINKNLPYSCEDFNLCVIYVKELDKNGFFVFPTIVMQEYKLILANGIGGKLGFRVYPDWSKLDSRIAIKTQSWQIKYFINLANDLAENIAKLKSIINQEIKE